MILPSGPRAQTDQILLEHSFKYGYQRNMPFITLDMCHVVKDVGLSKEVYIRETSRRRLKARNESTRNNRLGWTKYL